MDYHGDSPIYGHGGSDDHDHSHDEHTPLKVMSTKSHKGGSISKSFHVGLHLDGGGHIFAYDAKSLGELGCCMQWHGTFIASQFIWYQWATLTFVQFALAGGFYSYWTDPTKIPTDIVTSLAEITNALVSFLLSLFVTSVVQRWWAVRTEAVGKLFSAMDSLSLLISVFHGSNSSYDQWLRNTLRRYLMAAHEVVYIASVNYEARENGEGDEIVETLDICVELGFLTEDEKTELNRYSNQAMCIWVWVAKLVAEYAQLPREASEHAVEHCLAGRTATQAVNTFVETPLPFAYVHIIVFIVKVAIVVLVMQAAMVTAKSYASGSINSVCVQTFMVVFVPSIYQGLLTMDRKFRNPFGHNMSDFPRQHYRQGCYSRAIDYAAASHAAPFMRAAMKPPTPLGNLMHGTGSGSRFCAEIGPTTTAPTETARKLPTAPVSAREVAVAKAAKGAVASATQGVVPRPRGTQGGSISSTTSASGSASLPAQASGMKAMASAACQGAKSRGGGDTDEDGLRIRMAPGSPATAPVITTAPSPVATFPTATSSPTMTYPAPEPIVSLEPDALLPAVLDLVWNGNVLLDPATSGGADMPGVEPLPQDFNLHVTATQLVLMHVPTDAEQNQNQRVARTIKWKDIESWFVDCGDAQYMDTLQLVIKQSTSAYLFEIHDGSDLHARMKIIAPERNFRSQAAQQLT
jgi:predicted membrane chloride channel (bestrophin family)